MTLQSSLSVLCEYCASAFLSLKLTLSVFRIGRPPKYRKNQQRDYQSEFSCMNDFILRFLQHAKYIHTACSLRIGQLVGWLTPSLCVSLSSAMSSEGVYPSLFMSALNSQSDRTLSLCWEQHCKLLPGVQGIHANQVAAWSVEEVSKP